MFAAIVQEICGQPKLQVLTKAPIRYSPPAQGCQRKGLEKPCPGVALIAIVGYVHVMNTLLQVVSALLPLLLTPALIYALAEGFIDFGGGEKDIILALPWLVWSAVFALCALVLIHRRWAVRKWVLRSALISTVVLAGLGLIAYTGSFLGIA